MGSGADAGVGVAIWSIGLSRPQAGRLLVPDAARRAWSSARPQPGGPFYDIQEVEGLGIDNNGALSCLVKGGSRVMGADTIVGMRWHKCGEISACPWFDRVDTKPNPVDGLSRRNFAGNWDMIPLVFPGAELSCELRRARRFAPS
mgnify:CR=1 FL=1